MVRHPIPRAAAFALTAAVLALVAALPAPALATAVWTSPIDFTPTSPTTYPIRAAVAPDGTIAIGSLDAGTGRIEVQVRPPGGPLGSPEFASPDGTSADAIFDLAFDGADRLTVIWSDTSAKKVWETERPAAGGWSAPTGLSPNNSETADGGLAIAENAAGDAVVAWRTDVPGPDTKVRVASRTAGAAFGPSALVTGSAGAGGFTFTPPEPFPLAIDAAGDAVVGFAVASGSSGSAAVATRDAGAAGFTAATTLPAIAGKPVGWEPQVGIDAHGNAVALYRVTDLLVATQYALAAAVRAHGGSWSGLGAMPLGTATLKGGDEWHLAVDQQGTAYALWTASSSPSVTSLYASTRPPGGGFPNPALLQNDALYATVAARAGGGAIAASREASRTAAFANPGSGAFDQAVFGPEAIASTGSTPGLGYGFQALPDAGGDVVLAFLAEGTAHAQALVLDGSGPVLRGLSVPATAVAGTAVPLAVAPVDAFSGLGVTTWDYGDGTSQGAGTQLTHTYTTPGTYTVTVTSRDANGNTSSATGTIQVQAPVPPAGADHTPPVLSVLKLSAARFRAGSKTTALSAAAKRRARKIPRGTTITFKLSERADVTIALARRKGKRFVAAGTLRRRSMAPGKDRIAFSGRLGRKALKPATYRLTLTARDTAGNTSRPRTATFTVVR